MQTNTHTNTQGVTIDITHTCIHTCMHTYIHTYTQGVTVDITQTYNWYESAQGAGTQRGGAYILHEHTHIHTYTHTHIHTYIHTYIHTRRGSQSTSRRHSTGMNQLKAQVHSAEVHTYSDPTTQMPPG